MDFSGSEDICVSEYDEAYPLNFGDVVKSTGSDDQLGYGCCWGGGDVSSEAGGLGLPRMAERMEYSRPATSESNAKVVGSKELLSNGSF